ncbi:MAG TPA: YigZ family protein [Marinilabiliaceae bacterium]|nr:YigZ family protein [Marinilabiliaceae bacterium]
MESSDEYKTIQAASEGIYKEKGSKFTAYAYPIESEEEAKALIDSLKRQYYDARHHCFAWQLGMDGMNFRANDDGEPSGTAGKPIHGQILSNELTNILIVVVRYFGGTKLGTSGLIQAYREAAADAIENAEIITKTIDNYYTILFQYADMNDVMRIIKEEEPNLHRQKFDLNCEIELSIRQSRSDIIMSRFSKVESLKIKDEV